MRSRCALCALFTAGAVLLAMSGDRTVHAQGPTGPWITCNPKTDVVTPTDATMYAEGDYKLGAGQTVDYVEASWYTTLQDGSLKFQASNKDSAPANGKYKTASTAALPRGVNYTVLSRLYVKNNTQWVAIGGGSITP